MNGIYDFEKYRTPYLDTAMLIERKEKKENLKLMILAGIASILMVVMVVYFGVNLFQNSTVALVVMAAVVAVYVIASAFVIGKFLKKKGDNKWQQQLQVSV